MFSKESHLNRSCPRRTRARTHQSFHHGDTGRHPEEQSPPALHSQVPNLFAFATGCRAKNYLQVCSPAHFRADARYILILSLQRHQHGLACMRAAPMPPLSGYHCRWPCVSAPSRYSDLHSWLIFAPFYPYTVHEYLQYYFIDGKTIIFFVIIFFSEVSIPATRCINNRVPGLGSVPASGLTHMPDNEAQAMGADPAHSQLHPAPVREPPAT